MGRVAQANNPTYLGDGHWTVLQSEFSLKKEKGGLEYSSEIKYLA